MGSDPAISGEKRRDFQVVECHHHHPRMVGEVGGSQGASRPAFRRIDA
jgi:hypothetical protein